MESVLLTPAAARVVASLVEKAIVTPQYYPMTVNALMLAANQKTSRAPVLNLNEGDIGAALNELEGLALCVRDDRSGRALKWRHAFQHAFLLNPVTLAVLATLMLRGPQTAAELRANAAALGGPADVDALNEALRDLGDRAQPLAMLLPRAPGQKEARYGHLLCGTPPLMAEPPAAAPASAPASNLAALEQRLRELEDRIAALERATPPA